MGARYRILVVATHPVQYASVQFRLMAQHPRLDVQVAYCGLQGAAIDAMDREFGISIRWDVPLLDGYPWIHVRNISRSISGGFLRLINPGLWRLITSGGFDAVAVLTGYTCATFWIVAAAARVSGAALLFGADAHEVRSRNGSRLKLELKRRLWPWIFRIADVVIVPSTGSVAMMRTLGVPRERIALTPYTVDNAWWKARATAVDRASVRREWKIPDDAAVVAFCAKLQPWKRPEDLLRAFTAAEVPASYLVLAGEGPCRGHLEAEARRLGIDERVRFLGFVNQSRLPSVYRASDLLVLPSEYEPFGVVVNEAMLCGIPAIVSDRVGARYDLVREGETGFVYPSRDVAALARRLRDVLSQPQRLRSMGLRAAEVMETWSPRETVSRLADAVERAVDMRRT